MTPNNPYITLKLFISTSPPRKKQLQAPSSLSGFHLLGSVKSTQVHTVFGRVLMILFSTAQKHHPRHKPVKISYILCSQLGFGSSGSVAVQVRSRRISSFHTGQSFFDFPSAPPTVVRLSAQTQFRMPRRLGLLRYNPTPPLLQTHTREFSPYFSVATAGWWQWWRKITSLFLHSRLLPHLLNWRDHHPAPRTHYLLGSLFCLCRRNISDFFFCEGWETTTLTLDDEDDCKLKPYLRSFAHYSHCSIEVHSRPIPHVAPHTPSPCLGTVLSLYSAGIFLDTGSHTLTDWLVGWPSVPFSAGMGGGSVRRQNERKKSETLRQDT